MVIKRVFRRMLDMCEPAYEIFLKALILSCVLLFCSIMIFIYIGGVTANTYYLYLLAKELSQIPAALMFIAGIGSVCIEEQYLK